jgi:hypothetical protein
MQVHKVFSATEIDRGANITPIERRTLVRTGVLKPARTAAGHAIFGEDDMNAAQAYKAQQIAARKFNKKR